jgi:hypothetical protein
MCFSFVPLRRFTGVKPGEFVAAGAGCFVLDCH